MNLNHFIVLYVAISTYSKCSCLETELLTRNAPLIAFGNDEQTQFSDDGNKLNIRKLYKFLQKFYLPIPKYIDNEQCSKVINKFLANAAAGVKSWSLRMGDSWGKIPDGFLFGNINAVGMFEECLQVKGEVGLVGESILFGGKYCSIYYRTPNASLTFPGAGSNDEVGFSRSGPGMIVLLQPEPFYYATCIPSVCKQEDLFISLNVTYEDHDREVSKITCQDNDGLENEEPFDVFDGIVAGIFLCLVLLVICGTVLDELRATIPKISIQVSESLKCFSVTKTFQKIFAYTPRSGPSITCLHGIRSITLVWIMTCHQYESGLKFSANTLDAVSYQDPIFGQFITNGYSAVDTFFCVSGILLAYRLFPLILNGKGMGYPQALARRFFRLFPSIFLVAIFCATLLRFLGWGPRHPYLNQWVLEECRDKWWKDPLFIDNFPTGSDNRVTVRDCLGHCWYTAIEMQFMIVLPFILLPFVYSLMAGTLWLTFVTTISIVVSPVVLYVADLPPIPLPYLTISEHYDFMTKYYLAPWCRASPWLIGICVGMLLAKKNRRFFLLRRIWILVGFVLAIGIGLSITMGMYKFNHIGEHIPMKRWEATLLGLLTRPLWALAVSWVVVTCHTGQAGYVNCFLSWWGWQPLSRLTFGMYLVSPVVQLWWSSVLYVPVYFSYFGKLYETSGTFFVSFVMAVLLCTFVEQPFLRLSHKFSSNEVSETSVSIPKTLS